MRCPSDQTLDNSLFLPTSGSLRQFFDNDHTIPLLHTAPNRLNLRYSRIDLDDDILFEAISTWPHIQSLIMVDSRLCPPTVTFRRLFTALRPYPHLHTLQSLINIVNFDGASLQT